MLEWAAVIGLGELALKAIRLASDLRQSHRDGARGVAVTTGGESYGFAQPGYFEVPATPGLQRRSMVEPVSISGTFVPGDEWAADLPSDRPVMVIIEDLDEESELDSIVCVTSLAEGFEGSLLPGAYRFGALVFGEDDPRDWSEEALEGGSDFEFVVRPGDPPLEMEVPIGAGPAIIDHDEGYLRDGEPVEHSVDLEPGVTYGVYVAPVGSDADLDIGIFDPDGNLVASDDDLDSDALCVFEAGIAGTYTIEVTSLIEDSAYEIFLLAA